MRQALVRSVVVVVTAVGLVLPSLASGAAIVPSEPAPAPAGALPSEVVAAALAAPGTVVRRAGSVRVERIATSAALRASFPSLPDDLYRVTVSGRFPPRDLRYVVAAAGDPVGIGVPGAAGRTVTTITADASVLTATVTAETDAPGGETVGGPADGARARVGDLPDPAAGGPYAVTRAVYNLGKEVFQPSALSGKVDLVGDVHYPTDLGAGPFPLVVFMHGNHWTCYRPDTGQAAYRWPCREGWRALPNYAGYDYIARRLASFGYVVVSVSANGVNVLGNSVEDSGMRQRGEVIEKHLDLWNQWNTTGGDPFGTTFVGAIDMSRIGTMGHSRGGEGAIWNEIVDRERPEPYGIDAVLALAPVDFTRATINDVPFTVMLPYCDGDVSDLQGVHFFDDSRYLVPGDPAAKSTVAVFGANHNFFNTVWSPSGGYPGAFDDGQNSGCTDRLTEIEQRRVGASYVVGFFRRYVGEEAQLDPMWTGAESPASIAPARTLVSYLAPDTPETRMDVDRYTEPGDLSSGETGGTVVARGIGMYGWCANTYDTPCVPGNDQYSDRNLPGLSEGLLGWGADGGTLRFRLPPRSRDVSGFDALTFRAVVNPGYDQNLFVQYQDLSVALVDGGGRQAQVAASDVGNEALRYPLDDQGAGHVLMNQVRFPLDRFGGVHLDDIRWVEFRLNRTAIGVIDLSDVAFAASAA